MEEKTQESIGEFMWVFYHNVTSGTPDPAHVTSFLWGVWMIVTGVIIMTPSFLEKKRG